MMVSKRESIGYILALTLMVLLLNGCVSTILVPVALNLAAEGVSIQTTGQTLTENLKEAMLEEAPEQADASIPQYPGQPLQNLEPPQL